MGSYYLGLGKGCGTLDGESTDENDSKNGDVPRRTRQYERFLQSIVNEKPVSGDLKVLMDESLSDTDSSDDAVGGESDSCEDGEGGDGDSEAAAGASSGMSSKLHPKRNMAAGCSSRPS